MYNVRLGEVHGELQAVSRYLRSAVDGRPVAVVCPDAPSDAIFPATIANAMIAIATGAGGAPGPYTLVEDPAWSTREVLELYASQAGVPLRIVNLPPPPSGIGFRELLRAATRTLADNKELLTAHVIPGLPALESRLKAWHQKRRAAAEVTGVSDEPVLAHAHLVGPVPGRRLQLGLRESPVNGRLAREVRRVIESGLGPGSHNFRDRNSRLSP